MSIHIIHTLDHNLHILWYIFYFFFCSVLITTRTGPEDSLQNRLLFNIAHRMGDEAKLMKCHQHLKGMCLWLCVLCYQNHSDFYFDLDLNHWFYSIVFSLSPPPFFFQTVRKTSSPSQPFIIYVVITKRYANLLQGQNEVAAWTSLWNSRRSTEGTQWVDPRQWQELCTTLYYFKVKLYPPNPPFYFAP